MRRARSWTQVGIALAVLVFGSQVSLASQLNLIPVLQISGQYSSNVFFSEDDKQSDTFWLVVPGVALDYASSNLVASVAYQVGLQRHQEFDDRDNTVHRIDANLGLNLSSGFYLSVTDNLYITNDPLAFDASGDRIQRDSFTYNRITPNISYIFGSRDVRIAGRYDRIDVNYDNLTDSSQNGLGVNVSAKLGARSTLGFDYTYFNRKFDEQDPEFSVVDYKGNRFGVLVDRRFSPRFSLSAFGGYEKRTFEEQPEIRDFDSFIYEIRGVGEVPDVFSYSASIGRRLNDLAIQGAYVVDRLDFDIRKTVADRLRLQFGGYIQKSENDQIPEEADYFGFRAEGQYMVAKFLNVWLGYEFTERDSDDGTIDPYDETRINFGLTLSYGI